MATSGVYELQLTSIEVLEQAFDLLQIGTDGETLTADMRKRGLASANLLIKEWEEQGIHLWADKEGVLFTEKGRFEYPFSDSTVHLANEYFETTIDAAEASGQTVVSVTSTDNMQVSDVVGVVQSDGSLHWSTVQSISPGDTFNMPNPLVTDAVVGAKVFFYRPDSFIPVSRVMKVRRKSADGYEIPVNFDSRTEYFDLPDKTSMGEPVLAYYSRQIPQGIMYLWTAPNDTSTVIPFTYERQLQILTDNDQTLDIPQSALNTLIYNLAVELIPKYGCSEGRITYLTTQANQKLANTLAFDNALQPIKVKLRRR